MPVVSANIFDKKSIAKEIFWLSLSVLAQPVSGKTIFFFGVGAVFL
jgi:hypothetical protein